MGITRLSTFWFSDQIDIHVDEVPDLKRLCRQCHLLELQEKLEHVERKFHYYGKSHPDILLGHCSFYLGNKF